MPTPRTRRVWPLIARLARALIITAACCMCVAALAYAIAQPLTNRSTVTAALADRVTAVAPLSLVAARTALSATPSPSVSARSAPAAVRVEPMAARDRCRTERRGGRDRAVIGAGPVEIAIDVDLAACTDSHRTRSRADDDRDCRCDRDKERDRDRSSSRDRDAVIYVPADPDRYDSPGRGYYPREGYGDADRSGDRPGHVCRRVRPGEHPDLPDGGLICISAERAPRGW